jgi:anti-sigma factor RsiW
MTGDVEHLTCRELVEVLTEYLEGVLDPAQRADIERHIVLCGGCAHYVGQMDETLRLLGLLAGDEPEVDVPVAALLPAFREWQARRA